MKDDIGGQIYDNRDWAVFPNYEGNTDYPFLYLLGNIQDLPVDVSAEVPKPWLSSVELLTFLLIENLGP